MISRYQRTTAIVFSNGVIVPFWKCSFAEDDYYGESFFFNGEESKTSMNDVVWDIKEEKFVSFYVIESKQEAFAVGKTVAFENENGKITIETINDVKYEKFTDYFENYSHCKKRVQSLLSKGASISKDVSIIVFRHLLPTYYFESGKSADCHYAVKEIEI